ncbi:acid phosphatase [Stylonychia lemnae]|uniref:Acid phosphatase n=1 Tax=Stylonychia lemnae TaxID=5949 RepID=A0A078AHM1_STYLE|nr:acid phosphatase [Stylonychia lemnae]|eukprot:CDW81744.1 acid phosphatase [Stylonychia lemnae]
MYWGILYSIAIFSLGFLDNIKGALVHQQNHEPQNLTPLIEQKVGLDFFMVGDYGWVRNMTPAYLTFDKMNEIAGNKSDPRNDIDFFLTMGDNLYSMNSTNPSDEDFDIMMSLFYKRDNLKDKNIYAVRGNHECYFEDDMIEVNLTKKYPNWQMPNLYYSKLFDIGNGKKLGIIFVDSCLALCSNYSFADDHNSSRTPHDNEYASEQHFQLVDRMCNDPRTLDLGAEMFQWMKDTMNQWDDDSSIIWKATVQHHPLFGKWYQDYAHLVSDYMPLMLDHKFDFYFNGHEHTLEYANYPYSQVTSVKQNAELHTPKGRLMDYACLAGQEMLYGDEDRNQIFTQGEALHQFTTGSTGFDLYLVCPALPSMGRYKYTQNIYHGFSQVHVDENEFTVKFLGVDEFTNDLIELYKVTVIHPGTNKQEQEKDQLLQE